MLLTAGVSWLYSYDSEGPQQGAYAGCSSPLGEFSSPAAACCLETETFPSSPCRHRQAFLGHIAAVLVRVETGIDSRPAGDRCAMAPRRLQTVLDMALAASSSRGQEVRRKELCELIFRMVAENPTWGAPRIHGELKMLGFEFLNGPCCAGCGKRHGIRIRQSDGRPF